jgi:integrase
MKFTDRGLRALKPGVGERLTLSDDAEPGLLVRASATSVTFYCDYRFQGKRRRIKIGRYPSIGLADARARVREFHLSVARGVDPAGKPDNLPTVEDAFDEYDQHHLSNLKHAHERRQVLKRELAQMWSSPVVAVTRNDLEAILRKKRKDGKAGNRVRAYLKAFFGWVSTETMMLEGQASPAAVLTRPVKEAPRDRLLTVEEVRSIYDAALEAKLDAVALLILTAARRSEITDLKWGEVDTDAGRIELSGERTKNGKPHVIHLSAPALAIIEAQPCGSPDDFVLQKRVLNRAKDHLPDLDSPWRLHDFRRAFATAMSERGTAIDVIELTLGHSLSRAFGSIVSVYNRAERLPDRARALDAWGAIVTDQETKVVKLHAE